MYILFRIKGKYKKFEYYYDNDFIEVIKKIADLKKTKEYNEYINSLDRSNDSVQAIHLLFRSIHSIKKYDENKNLVLLKLGEKKFQNFLNTKIVKFYKLLYNNQLIWLESSYIEKLF